MSAAMPTTPPTTPTPMRPSLMIASSTSCRCAAAACEAHQGLADYMRDQHIMRKSSAHQPPHLRCNACTLRSMLALAFFRLTA